MFPYISDIFHCMFYEHQFLQIFDVVIVVVRPLWLSSIVSGFEIAFVWSERSHKSWKFAKVKKGLMWGRNLILFNEMLLWKCFYVPFGKFQKLNVWVGTHVGTTLSKWLIQCYCTLQIQLEAIYWRRCLYNLCRLVNMYFVFLCYAIILHLIFHFIF